jgi:hypothetical protein
MDSELRPSFVIPLDSSLSGGVAEPGLQFAGSPPMLFVAEPAWDPSWVRWFSWHTPDIAAGALLIAGAVVVWAVLQLMRGGRAAGAMYCRGCGHELALPQVRMDASGVGIWANEEAKCPECGKRDERGPVRGARVRWKAVTVLVVSFAICITCGVMLASSLRVGGKLTAGRNETWPVVGLERVMGSWAPQRRLYSMAFEAFRFVRVDPETGAREDLGTVDTSMPRLMEFVSPDGKYVIASARRDHALVVINTNSKQSRRVSLAPNTPGFRGYLMVVQFSSDVSNVFVSCAARNGDKRRDELFAVELATGVSRSLAVVEFQSQASPKPNDSYSQFLVAEAGAETIWVHQVSRRGASGPREEVVLRWESADGKRERTEHAAGGMLMVRISEDGKYCVMEAGAARKSWAFALEDGLDLEDVSSIATKRLEMPRLMLMSDGRGKAVVRDFGAFALPRATLRVNAAGFAEFVQSKGDRFVAVVGDRAVEQNWISRLLGVPARKGSEVRIWDLQPVLDQKFGEERAVPKKP